MNKPILYLIFNRLDYVQKSFSAIRKAQPPRLYISSDAARDYVVGEREKIDEVRNWVLANIDWNCSVKTRYNITNEGSALLNNAISWFFENEYDGIIMEDDVLPTVSFFSFCEELLDKYRDNKIVWNISGNQFVPDYDNGASYYFGFPDLCAWATWADRWKYFESDAAGIDENSIRHFFRKQSKEVESYWISILNSLKSNEVNDWDYKWTLSIIKHNGLSINPSKNLSTNFGITGTHFDNAVDSPLFNVPTFEITSMVHPIAVEFDQKCMKRTFEIAFGIKKKTSKEMFLNRIIKIKRYLKKKLIN